MSNKAANDPQDTAGNTRGTPDSYDDSWLDPYPAMSLEDSIEALRLYHQNEPQTISIDQPMSDPISREEVDSKLALTESKAETIVTRMEGKINAFIAEQRERDKRMDQLFAHTDKSIAKFEDKLDHVKYWAIGTALFVLGVFLIFSYHIDNKNQTTVYNLDKSQRELIANMDNRQHELIANIENNNSLLIQTLDQKNREMIDNYQKNIDNKLDQITTKKTK